MVLTPTNLIKNLFKDENMLTCEPQYSVMSLDRDLKELRTPVSKENRDSYQSRVGSLFYLSAKMRPDLSLIASTFGYQAAKQTDVQLKGVESLFQYLNGTCDAGLHLNLGDYAQLSALVNPNWYDYSSGKRRRQNCMLIRYCDTISCNVSTVQKCLSLTWTEAVYMALSES